ncbi:MAG: hypothetical protein GX617_01910 [Lentisphaerae bacterium]|nr:hypothetical protein [Lentisphaerota bacterium]
MKNGGLSCRSAAIHAADKKTQRGHFASREGVVSVAARHAVLLVLQRESVSGWGVIRGNENGRS